MKKIGFFLFCLAIFGCDKAQKVPNFISYQFSKDSVFVHASNGYLCPMFITVEDREKQNLKKIELAPNSIQEILAFSRLEIDTIQLKSRYLFKGLWYGKVNFIAYDTTYNYALPFQKGKRYKILQGQNTRFTHKVDFSKYAIDFKMNVGQTVCAMRDGIVVKVIEKYNKGGRSKKYRPLANLIVIYHNDGTFSQYVHLKKNGSLVKVGDFVEKGQAIGYSGNTGMSTEPHLHFAVYKPTESGLVSIPYILDSIPTKKYVKGKFAFNN